MTDATQKVIDKAVERLNELLPKGQALPNDPATVLLGPGCALDSMDFVNLVVAVEEELAAQLGVQVVLSDHVGDATAVRTLGDLGQVVEKIAAGRKSA